MNDLSSLRSGDAPSATCLRVAANKPGVVPPPGASARRSKPWERRVEPELLDLLPADDPRAIRSRRELRRVNAAMHHAAILSRALRESLASQPSLRLVEIGAGDGELLFRVARRLRGCWPRVDATLVDRQDILKPEIQTRFAELNWRVQSATDDVLRWLQHADGTADVILANLVLHHFHDNELRELFARAAERTGLFVALEPRRARWPLFCARLLPLIGFRSVTCHDAAVSVRAGFARRELSALWPDGQNWELIERSAGPFSHLFLARNRGRIRRTGSVAVESRHGGGTVPAR